MIGHPRSENPDLGHPWVKLLTTDGLNAVEDVAAMGVGCGESGMVEVVGWVMGHAELFHNAAGAEVGGNGKGDDLFKSEISERVMKDSACAFSGEALAPVVEGEAPADFDGGVGVEFDGQFEGRNIEADVADEGAGSPEFCRPEAKAMEGEVSSEAMDHAGGFYGIESGGVVLHDAGISVYQSKWGSVREAPAAEQEAVRLEIECRAHGMVLRYHGNLTIKDTASIGLRSVILST